MQTACTVRSLVENNFVDLPSGVTRSTVAGVPVARYAFPSRSAATDHTYVEGVVKISLLSGPATRCPSLVIATPSGLPFSNSSNFDWDHRRVPCACIVTVKKKIGERLKRKRAKRRIMLKMSLLERLSGGRGGMRVRCPDRSTSNVILLVSDEPDYCR